MIQKIFDRHNLNLLKSIIPNKELPIYGNSFFDPNNEDFNKPIKDLKYEKQRFSSSEIRRFKFSREQ
jgi:hypothetical protein